MIAAMVDWQISTLGQCCLKIGSGATPRGGKEAYLGGATTLIRSQNVYNEGFARHGLAFIDEAQASELSNVEVAAEDVLLNITGDSVARCCQVPLDVLPARVNQHVSIIRTDKQQLDPRFLKYLLIEPRMQQRLLALASAGATRNALTKSMIERLEIAHPKVSEQRAIAHVLGSLDDKIELNRRNNQTLEAIGRAVFRDWFVDFGPVHAKAARRGAYLAADVWDAFPERFDGAAPQGWTKGPISAWVMFNPTETLRKGSVAPYLDMAALPTEGATPDQPAVREYGSGMKFRNGDSLMARITPCLENGKTAFVQSLPDDAVAWGSTEFIVMRPIAPVPQPYAYLLARDAAFREHAIRSMTGTSGRQRAQVQAIASFPVCLPTDESVWKAFAAVVDPLFAGIRVNAEESRTLADLRDVLLPKLMSGDIRIKDAERFIEEATT
jgi:type I restriction enzyme S subunit